jgi:hypothetical protein
VRRLTLPRIPAPPEAMRGTDLGDAQAPTVSAVEPSARLTVPEIASSR